MFNVRGLFNHAYNKGFRLYVQASSRWRSIRTSTQDHVEYLDRVGPEKPLGYTCYYGKSLKKDWNTRKIEDAMYAKGLKTKLHKSKQWYGPVQTLYVYHEDALRSLLQENKDVLDRYGWSTDPEEFVDNVMKYQAPVKTDLFDLIADAFADYENWWRTDQDVPHDVLEDALRSVRDNPDDYAHPII